LKSFPSFGAIGFGKCGWSPSLHPVRDGGSRISLTGRLNLVIALIRRKALPKCLREHFVTQKWRRKLENGSIILESKYPAPIWMSN